jgi:hypothetical protein
LYTTSADPSTREATVEIRFHFSAKMLRCHPISSTKAVMFRAVHFLTDVTVRSEKLGVELWTFAAINVGLRMREL